MNNTNVSSTSCGRLRAAAARIAITGRSRAGSSGFFGPVPPGETFQSGTGGGGRPKTGFAGGLKAERFSGLPRSFRENSTLRAESTGSSWVPTAQRSEPAVQRPAGPWATKPWATKRGPERPRRRRNKSSSGVWTCRSCGEGSPPLVHSCDRRQWPSDGRSSYGGAAPRIALFHRHDRRRASPEAGPAPQKAA